MKLSLMPVLAASGLVALLAGVACSSADDAAPSDLAPAPNEGGTLPPAPDAAAPVEAGADADAEAGPPRVCSDDGFCHTSLPPMALPSNKHVLRGVWADGAGTAWAVTEAGAILRYDGKSWSEHATVKSALGAIWGSSPTDVWIGGADGLLHGEGATPASLVFTPVDTPGDGSAAISSIWGTGANDVWAVGGAFNAPFIARVLHYAGPDVEGGTGWSLEGISSQPIFTSRVWGTPASGVWVAGLRNDPVTIETKVVVLRRASGATKFAEVPIPGDPKAPEGVGEMTKLFGASASADGTMWILGRTNSSAPGFVRGLPTLGQTYAFTFVAHGPSVGPLSNFVWGRSADDAWIGGEYGRLRHWDGTAWTQAKTTITKYPDTTTLNAIWGNASGELWVVGEGIAMHRDAKKN